MKGKFITFEGCEGVGKSHQIKYLEEYLKNQGVDYYLTREPGGSDIAEQIRRIILDGKNTAMTDECEALLYAAARVQHLDEIVKPKLEAGTLVLCDRYDGYVALAKEYPDRILRIDASGAKTETHKKIIDALREKGIIK